MQNRISYFFNLFCFWSLCIFFLYCYSYSIDIVFRKQASKQAIGRQVFTWFNEQWVCTNCGKCYGRVNLLTLAIFVVNITNTMSIEQELCKTEYLIFLIYFVFGVCAFFFLYCYSYSIDIVFLSNLYGGKTELQMAFWRCRTKYPEFSKVRFGPNFIHGYVSDAFTHPIRLRYALTV